MTSASLVKYSNSWNMLLKRAILTKYGEHENTMGYNKNMGEVGTLTVNGLNDCETQKPVITISAYCLCHESN